MDFEKLKREHNILKGLYRVSCKDGIWDYFDKTKNYTARIIECEDDFLEHYCEMCGKSFIPTLEYVYRDCDEDDDAENFYCSWTCFRKRDEECCPMCGKNFRISRDEHCYRTGPYDEEYDNYYCSWDCLDKALEDNEE